MDMRGPEVRVFSSFDELQRTQGEKGEGAGAAAGSPQFAHELHHNVRQLVHSAEEALREAGVRRRHEAEGVQRMRRERAQLDAQTQQQRRRIDGLREVLSTMRSCFALVRQAGSGGASHQQQDKALEQLGAVLEALRSQFADVYAQYDVARCAAALAAPLLRRTLRVSSKGGDSGDDDDGDGGQWSPLQQPRSGVDLLHRWRRILSADQRGTAAQTAEAGDDDGDRGAGDTTGSGSGSEAFSLLVEDLVLPRMRRALQREWQVRDSERAVLLIEAWRPLMPRPLLRRLLHGVILPRLERAVEQEWQPHRELLHLWIHPWLPLLGEQMRERGLFDTVLRKFAVALRTWTPDDPSAHAALLPWRDVLQRRAMDRLLVTHVLPKLEHVLRSEFEVDPSDQDILPFAMVIRWHGLLPDKFMVPLLERHFFTKWNAVLYRWLTSAPSGPDFGQVHTWYLGWKSVFPPQLAESHRRVRRQFNQALDMINQALSGQPVTMGDDGQDEAAGQPSRPFEQHLQQQQQRQERRRGPSATTVASAAPAGQPSFKELLEFYALQHDILFAPRVGQLHEGKQVYDFGGVPIFIREQCVFAKSRNLPFSPVTLEQLMQLVSELKGHSHS